MATSNESAAHRSVIEFCVGLGMTPVQTYSKMVMVEKHSHISRALVYKWHRRYSDGLVEDKENLNPGRPRTIDINVVNRVRETIDADRRQTVREISGQLDISKSSVHRILSDELSMSRVCARWVPRILKPEEKERRVNASREFLQRHQEDETFLKRIVT